ncbi:probable ubiquitin-conjugating enzyme E2 24 [Phragmites australis]|uniref:probable ubiquitin-conjugating enzyme E2 24 n=1 Tax=Phragmites australis TaxID=29695 RepID=UPI002D784D82|nr:probable ubiquitin-conjugating enzyme E2 24 [Phragmites australis]
MDLFAIDSDCESYSGTSDSEDQEECEFTYSDHAQNILSSLDESIGKIDDFLTFERGFLHGDIVCPVSDPSSQLGRVVGVAMFVDLETSSGDIIKDVNSKKLSRVRSFVSGDCVVMGPWIGRVIRAFDLVSVVFSDGAKCEMLLKDSEVLKPIPPILFEDAPYFYYPGQRVRIIHPSVSKSGTWLCGSWRPSRDEGVVSHVDVGLVHVNWIASVTNVWGDQSSSPPNFQDPKNLTLLSCFPYANWQLGDWCALRADDDGCLWMNSSKYCVLRKAQKCDSRMHMGFQAYGSSCSQTYVVAKTKSTVDVLWQNGSISLGLEPQTLVPVSTLGDHEFWPGQFVLEKLTVEDAGRCQRAGIVRDVDAHERTVNVKWIVAAGSDTVSYGSDPNVETVSAYELVEHPDFSFCIGEVVIRSAVNIGMSETDLTKGSIASRESLVTASGFLSCIGNVLGYKDDEIEVQWASGVVSKVQHFEIIGLDRLLDSSLELTNEEHTTVDVAEQEEMHHGNTNNAQEEYTEDCTGSLCKATAFLFPTTAFDFLTNVAASLFGTHGSPSSSSVMVDPRYQIVNVAELQPSAEEFSEAEQIVELVAQIEKPNLSSEDGIPKRFDVVTDCSDHHFVKENDHENVTRVWVKKVQQEWTILQNDLPDGIHVRVYEERMDLLRACIVGAAGTPYHDNLFFFDIFFPPDYPHEPPSVYYHSGGLRLNPNLYESGKVCLSLLKTWTGTGNEVWNPENSTVLQLLLSLQALVLNEKPYFNEAGYDKFVGKADGEKNSITYNENAFLLSCKSMMYVLHKPPKHFEKFVKEHFTCRAPRILDACDAYLGGDLVGHARDNAYISEDGSKNCSTGFKIMLAKLLPKLGAAFSEAGITSDQ